MLYLIYAIIFVGLIFWSVTGEKNKVDHTIARILDGTPNHTRRITDK